jgi:protein gp37
MSKIEWTNETWNIITGCKKISEGCRNCYAATMHKRLTAMGQEKYKFPFENIVFHYDELARVFKGKHKMVFVNSMSDTFNEKISGEQITKILAACGAQPQHEFQILTKRAERLPGFSYPDNVWLGVTVEKAQHKNRIDYLRQTNAKIKFLSCEPLLDDLGDLDLEGIHWVIAGGESGKNARPCNPQWVRNIQKQCKKAGVPFFFKQWGEWLPAELNKWNKQPRYMYFVPDNKNAIRLVVMPFEYIKKNYMYYIWQSFEYIPKSHNLYGCAETISLKMGKTKSGCLLDGKLYREMPLMATVEVNIV